MKNPLFKCVFALLMEFFQAYTYNDKPDEYVFCIMKLNYN